MTYNIRRGRDLEGVLGLDHIADVIRAQNPDIVALQEVGRHWCADSDFRDQAVELARRLAMASVFAANVERDPLERDAPRRQYGTAILSARPLLSSENMLLPRATPLDEQRGLLVLDVDVNGQALRMYNAHLGVSAAERRLQVQAILDEADKASGPHALLGDLNARPTAPELAPLFDRFRDAWMVAGEGDGFTFPVLKPRARIDYVLVSPLLRVRRVCVPVLLGSDHLPLVAELDLARRES